MALSGILLVALLFLSYLYFSGRQKGLSEKETVGSSKQELSYDIISQVDTDESGRTVFYDGRGFRDGSGIYYTNPELRDPTYMVGEFVRWEDIPGSKDKYIVLRYQKTKREFPRVRIEFEEDAPPRPTLLAVEDLSVGSSNPGDDLFLLGLVKDWIAEYPNLTQKGDAVVLDLKRILTGEVTARGEAEFIIEHDVNGEFIAERILIRRFGGKAQLEKELGIEIEPF